jgi:two-component system response regulator FixJ
MTAQVAVLVVDDDPIQCDSLVDVLESYPCNITPCTDPREALKIASRRRFDLILIDLKLPGMSGLDLIRRLRLQRPGRGRGHGVLLLLTGVAAANVAEAVLLAGADGVLEKPLQVEKLVEWLNEAQRADGDVELERGGRCHDEGKRERLRVGARRWQVAYAPR